MKPSRTLFAVASIVILILAISMSRVAAGSSPAVAYSLEMA